MKIDGKAEEMVKPAPRYAEIAAACRLMGMRIEDNEYERMDLLLNAQNEQSLLGQAENAPAQLEPPPNQPEPRAEPPPPLPMNVLDMT
jgi:hypothetical protein